MRYLSEWKFGRDMEGRPSSSLSLYIFVMRSTTSPTIAVRIGPLVEVYGPMQQV